MKIYFGNMGRMTPKIKHKINEVTKCNTRAGSFVTPFKAKNRLLLAKT